MTTVPPSTSEARPIESTGSRSKGGGFMAGGVWIPRLMAENELASTKREWAAKPPDGMESEPLDWDEITKL